jgi:hypothetical protein
LWAGPILAAIGIVAVIAALLPPLNRDPLARWILADTLAPARVLPLLGFGVALALIGGRALVAALALFALGVACGLFAQDRLLAILDFVPGAATHMFLTDPISYLAAGMALIAGTRRARLALAAAPVFGAMLGLTIRLTDPSLHEPPYTWMPLLTACWIVAAVALTVRPLRRGRFPVFARIFGSWLLAIGLIYGGVSLVPPKAAPPAATGRP